MCFHLYIYCTNVIRKASAYLFYSGNGAKRRYRFKKPSEGGAYRKRQNLHEASLLIILTARDILKPRNGKKKHPLGMKILYTL